MRVSIGIVLGADAKLHLYCDVFERTFHQLGQGKLGQAAARLLCSNE